MTTATSNAAVAGGASAPDCGATLAAAMGQISVPGQIAATATASSIAETHYGTRRDPVAFCSAGGDAGDGGKQH